jgi:toxin FitB
VRVLLDTSVLIEPGAVPEGSLVSVASISFAELAFGVRATTDLRQQALRQARLDRLRAELGPGLPFDDDAANAFGSLTALVVAAGRNPRSRSLDLMIAATAYIHDAGVVTRNIEDFADLQSLVPVFAA